MRAAPREDRDTCRLGRGQHLVEGLQPERIEDDLHVRHVRPRDRGERLRARLPTTPYVVIAPS